MAQVDFSNAVLDVNPNNAEAMPMTAAEYLYINHLPRLYNGNDAPQRISTNEVKTILSNTPAKVSILFTGSFTANGTEFYIGRNEYYTYVLPLWRVSNISFSSGDSYAFVIDIEVSGNT